MNKLMLFAVVATVVGSSPIAAPAAVIDECNRVNDPTTGMSEVGGVSRCATYGYYSGYGGYHRHGYRRHRYR